MPKRPQSFATVVRKTVRGLSLPALAGMFFMPVFYVTREPHLIVLGVAAGCVAAGLILRAADKRGHLPRD